jgi:hypothetical protein
LRDPFSDPMRSVRRRRARPRTSPRMTLLDGPASQQPRAVRDESESEPRVLTGMGPYESSYDVTHGYAVERPILVRRG